MTENSNLSGFSRRALLAGMAAAPALGAAGPAAAQTAASLTAAEAAQAALKTATGTKLVILGSAAGPVPGRSREMTSHVMLSNGAAYVLDCGLGVTDQFARTGIPFGACARFSSPITTPTTISNTARCWSSAGSRA